MNPTDKHEIMTRFAHDLTELHGLTPNSTRVHVGVAKRWWLYTGGRPFAPDTATSDAVRSFLADLDGRSTGTASRNLTGLRHFYRFAAAYALATINPAAAVTVHDTRPPRPAPNSKALVFAEWELSMKRRGLAAATIEARNAILRRWWQFAGDPFATDVTWRTVERFVDSLDLTAANSRYALVSHLHQFYSWARRYELCTTDPTELVERPRTARHLPRPIHDTDLAIALTLATGPIRAALLLASTSGLRTIELARLRWDDVAHDSIRIRGKGDRERVIPLHAAAREALDDLDRADAYVLPWRPSPKEQRTGADGGPTSRAINQYLRSVGVTATAHQLRHWCATQALRTSGDLRSVQELLGHASPATTAIYTKVDAGHLADVVAGIAVPVASNTDAPRSLVTS